MGNAASAASLALALALAGCGGGDSTGGGGAISVASILPSPTPTPTPSGPPAAFMPARFRGVILANSPVILIDPDGVPTVKTWCDPNFVYSPTTIAQWGLGGYARGDMTLAKKAADWLISIQRPDGGFPLNFSCIYTGGQGYHLNAPWLSAIAQGNGISLLVRMYRITGDAAYLTAATAALKPLSLPMSRGGVQGMLNGSVWFEESPDPDFTDHTFNGSVFALLGIHDLWQIGGDLSAKALWEQGEASLRANLNAHWVWAPFAPGAPNLPDPWMVYNLPPVSLGVPNYLTDFYARVHIELYQEMFTRTLNPVYSNQAAILQDALAKYMALHPPVPPPAPPPPPPA